MNKDQLRIQCHQSIDRLWQSISAHKSIIDVSMVDFITEDVFDAVLPIALRDSLLALSEEEVCRLPSKVLQMAEEKSTGERSDNALDELLAQISSLLPTSLGFVSKLPPMAASARERSFLLPHFDPIMGDKKMHEVALLGSLILTTAKETKVDTLLDLGSGKGYLGHAMASLCNFNVLAIDASEGNTKGANRRNESIERQWTALLRRAKTRACGATPPKRGKRGKGREGETESDLEDSSEEKRGGRLVADTQFVRADADLSESLKKHFGSESLDFGVVGLHTCGNLAADSLKIFLANANAKFCVNVGCCYHLLDELDGESGSFPLSSRLRSLGCTLGRKARMLSAQPVDRMAENSQLPTKSLLWRAIFQAILAKEFPSISTIDKPLGKNVAAKAQNFVDYCARATAKLELKLKLSEPEIEALYKELERKHGVMLYSFHQLRSLFAPLVEALILLDRLAFLLEQECIGKTSLVQLFDPIVSPRCYAIVAIKS